MRQKGKIVCYLNLCTHVAVRFSFLVSFAIVLTMAASSPIVAATGRPGDAENLPTIVHVTMYLLDVDEIDGAAQNFTANVYFEIRWHDPQLAHEGPGKMIRPLHEIWHPRMVIANQQRLWVTFQKLVDISPGGDVVYYQRVWGDFSQPLILRDFPFDRQRFEIHLAVVGYTPEEVELRVDSEASGLAADFSQPDWTVTGWDLESRLYNPDKKGEGVPSVVLFFDASRKSGYFILKVILPLILIVVMSWTVFWIAPSEAGTQISVAVTSILTLIAYRFMVDTMLPSISYLTRMDFFILSSTILIFFALIQVMVTSSLARKGREQQAIRIDSWCRIIFPVLFIGLCALAFWGSFG